VDFRHEKGALVGDFLGHVAAVRNEPAALPSREQFNLRARTQLFDQTVEAVRFFRVRTDWCCQQRALVCEKNSARSAPSPSTAEATT
jgi:hypothetical protein